MEASKKLLTYVYIHIYTSMLRTTNESQKFRSFTKQLILYHVLRTVSVIGGFSLTSCPSWPRPRVVHVRERLLFNATQTTVRKIYLYLLN